MAGRDRERRLARERYGRKLARRAAAAARARRRKQVAAAVLGAAAVVAAVVVLALRLDDDTATANPAASTRSPAASGAAASICPPGPSPVAAPTSFPTAPGQPAGLAKATSATINTNCGPLTLTLLPDQAPRTVSSFVFLARKGFFDGTPCHRVTTAGLFVLQCGDPTGSGTGGPGYTIPLENAPKDGRYPAGTVAMARSQDPDSGGSQFFVVYRDSRLPAPGYAVFGHVTKGVEVVRKVAAAGAATGADGPPKQSIGIRSIEITSAKASQ